MRMKTQIGIGSSKTFVRLVSGIGLVAALACSHPQRASAQIEGADILYHYNGTGIEAAPQEPGTPLSELFNRQTGQPFAGATYENDTGMDVTSGFDNNYGGVAPFDYEFSRVIIQQVSISPELSAFYQFDGVTPVFGVGADPNDPTKPIGFWELTENQVTGNAASGDLFAHALGIRGADQLYAGDDTDPIKSYFHQHFIFQSNDPGTYQFTYNVIGTLRNGGATLAPQQFTITYSPVAAVPEPGTLALLMAVGVSSAGLLRKYRRR